MSKISPKNRYLIISLGDYILNKVMLEEASQGIPFLTSNSFIFNYFKINSDLLLNDINNKENIKDIIIKWNNPYQNQKEIKAKKAHIISKSFTIDKLFYKINK